MPRRGDGIISRGKGKLKTWWLDCRINGQRHQVRLGKGITRSGAGELAIDTRARILRGEAGISKKRKDLTFDKAAELCLQWVEAHKRPHTYRCYTSAIENLKASFSGKKLGQIHPFLIEKYKTKRLKDEKPVALNRELSVLRNLVNRCIEWGKFQGQNPVRGKQLVRESKGRVRFLEPEEENELLAAATDEKLQTIILLGIYAGLRVKSEAMTLRKEDIDLKRGLLTVLDAFAKNGETRTVPINKERLLPALKKQMTRSKGEWLFTLKEDSPWKSLRTAFETAVRNAKLTGVTPHVLRHTFASRLAMAGVDLRTIQELGGWKTLKMVERYSHLSPSHKAEAVEKISNHFTTLFTTPENQDSQQPPQVIESK